VAFRYDGKDIATALGQGVDNKKTRAEAPVTFGYEGGTPIRFAGKELAENIGMVGDFGNSTKDPEMKDYFKDWTGFWVSGPFSPAPEDGGMA
jgi:hypothetical protein